MTVWTELTPAQKQEAVREALEVANLTFAQAAKVLGAPSRESIAGVVDRSKRSPEGRIAPKFQIVSAGAKSNVRKKVGGKRNATQIIQEKARRARATAKGADDEPVIAPVGDGRPLYARAWDALPGTSPVALEHHRDACRWPLEFPGEIDRACGQYGPGEAKPAECAA